MTIARALVSVALFVASGFLAHTFFYMLRLGPRGTERAAADPKAALREEGF